MNDSNLAEWPEEAVKAASNAIDGPLRLSFAVDPTPNIAAIRARRKRERLNRKKGRRRC